MNEFYSQNKSSKSKGNYIYYFSECKGCTKTRASKWQAENPESYRKTLRKYQTSDHAKIKQRERNKKMVREGKVLEWQRNNKDKIKEYNLYRSVNKSHEITKQEWEDCKKYFDYSCAYCGISEEEAKEKYKNNLHKDHADHQGANDLSNCIPACRSCNSKKHNFELELWFVAADTYSKERLLKINKWLNKDYKIYLT
ncbi:HNH endonuclease signature motif containing protein [Bacillus sp. FJAT-22090]|uniref:HNH endonuclease signature motif containing protein n=1 Tax=Bacillus sp. FJAT-22090 TaxID=1581038 RepID=UPI0011A35E11|nr:HNH endonuclease signature motif containing protein [Bacillus sp. FJAT-22090]